MKRDNIHKKGLKREIVQNIKEDKNKIFKLVNSKRNSVGIRGVKEGINKLIVDPNEVKEKPVNFGNKCLSKREEKVTHIGITKNTRK